MLDLPWRAVVRPRGTRRVAAWDRRNPIGEVICAVLLPVVEAIGWAKELPARVDAWLARASGEED